MKMKKKFIVHSSWFIVISFLFLSCGVYKLSYAEGQSKEEEDLFVAKKAFDDGFYEVSLDLLERFLKSYPNSAEAGRVGLLIGEAYFYQNRFLDALARFEKLLNEPAAKEIKDAVLYWIGEVHFKGNNFDKAASYYKMVVEQFPKSSYVQGAYYSLGWCYFQDRQFKESLKFFKIVKEKYPREPQAQDAIFKIIECLYNLKEFPGLKDEIVPYFKLYAKDTLRLSYLYFYLAEADYYLNDLNGAIEGYTKSMQISPDTKMQALAKLGLGWSYLKLKRYKESEDAFFETKPELIEKSSQDVLLLGKAILMTETNRVNEAKNLYDELLASSTDPAVTAQSYIGKADALYNLARYTEAQNVYQEAFSKVGENAPRELIDKLHYGLAWSYLKQGEFKEAINEFQKIVKSSDDKIVKVSALCQIGDTYQESGDYAKAAQAYDNILKDYTDSFYADYVQYQLGLTLLKALNYDGAILSFLNLKKNFPASKLIDEASYALGLVYFQKQDYNASKDTFEKFQKDFKDSNLKPQALYLLGASFYNLGNFTQAIEVFKEIIRSYGQDRELVQKAEYEIADCYYQMGDEKEAMTRFSALRSKYPDSVLTAEIIWWLGEYYYRHNDLVMARRYLYSLTQDFPQSNLATDAYYAIGSICVEESKYDEAIDNFKKSMEPGNSDLTGQAAVAIADIYLKQNKPELSIEAYELILKEYPGLQNVVYPKMAELYFKMDDFAKAEDFYKKSLDLVPVKEMAQIQLKIAEVKEAEGKLDSAIEEYLKVTYLYSQNSAQSVKALLRVARIYESRNNSKEALKIYKRVAGMDTEEAKYAKERIDTLSGIKGK